MCLNQEKTKASASASSKDEKPESTFDFQIGEVEICLQVTFILSLVCSESHDFRNNRINIGFVNLHEGMKEAFRQNIFIMFLYIRKCRLKLQQQYSIDFISKQR